MYTTLIFLEGRIAILIFYPGYDEIGGCNSCWEALIQWAGVYNSNLPSSKEHKTRMYIICDKKK
jgi:hypothetical protein